MALPRRRGDPPRSQPGPEAVRQDRPVDDRVRRRQGLHAPRRTPAGHADARGAGAGRDLRLVFAVDSIPAIFAVTRDPFTVFAANAFALLGLASLYFLPARMRDRFRAPKRASAHARLRRGQNADHRPLARPDRALAGGHPRGARHLDHRQPEGRAAGRCAMMAAWHGSTRASRTTSASGSRSQPLFFVGTAPLDAEGHVNVSPKGPIGSLRVIDAHRRSPTSTRWARGAETLAHVRENGRIVVMLCAFEGPPRILRLHGRARIRMAGEARVRRAARALWLRGPDDPRGAPRDRRRRGHARGRLVRLSRPADQFLGASASTWRCPPRSGCAPPAARRSCAPSRRRATRARSTACPRSPQGSARRS